MIKKESKNNQLHSTIIQMLMKSNRNKQKYKQHLISFQVPLENFHLLSTLLIDTFSSTYTHNYLFIGNIYFYNSLHIWLLYFNLHFEEAGW